MTAAAIPATITTYIRTSSVRARANFTVHMMKYMMDTRAHPGHRLVIGSLFSLLLR